jgi:hypothetical protein
VRGCGQPARAAEFWLAAGRSGVVTCWSFVSNPNFAWNVQARLKRGVDPTHGRSGVGAKNHLQPDTIPPVHLAPYLLPHARPHLTV